MFTNVRVEVNLLQKNLSLHGCISQLDGRDYILPHDMKKISKAYRYNIQCSIILQVALLDRLGNYSKDSTILNGWET